MKISDFYYGNITPSERIFCDNSEYARMGQKSMQLSAKLQAHLSADDCAMMEQLLDLNGKMEELMVAEHYIQGFREGASLMVDVLLGKSENLR